MQNQANKSNSDYNVYHKCAHLIIDVIDKNHSLGKFTSYDFLPKDQAFAQNVVFGVLRYYNLLVQIEKEFLKKPLNHKHREIQVLLLSAFYQLIFLNKADYAIVNETVNLCKKLKGKQIASLINAVLRSFLRNPKIVDKYKKVNLLPRWLSSNLEQQYNKADFKLVVAGEQQRPPLWIRINTNLISPDAYLASLEAANIEYIQHQQLEQAVIISNPIAAEQLPGFEQGHFFIQDLHAQLAALILKPNNQQTILDCCAAPGGKTTHLLELAPLAKVIAIEFNPLRVQRIEENLKRLQQKAQIVIADASLPIPELKDLTFDAILCDVPCSATGVIRRHPDIKWANDKQSFAHLKEIQLTILENNAALVKDNGHLLYATCSLRKEENSDIIQAFLEKNPNFKVVDLKAFALQCKVSHVNDTLYGLQLLPTAQGGDGFFYSLLQKSEK